MSNPIPSPLARPTEYVGGLIGVILIVLTDAGADIKPALLISLPILGSWITTGVVSFLEGRTADATPEVDADPDAE